MHDEVVQQADAFRDRFGNAYQANVSLARYVHVRLGGPARHFVEAKTVDDVTDALRLAAQFALPYFPLGGGSNVLIADEGWHGLVIRIALRGVTFGEDARVVAQAGALSAYVARQAAERALHGFSWAISLPGTIGGGVRGNAGCFGGEMKDAVTHVQVVRPDGVVEEIAAADLHFGYRHSVCKTPARTHDIVLAATLALTPGNREEELATLERNLASRTASQPLGAPSAGCMFKNVELTDAELAALNERIAVPAEMAAVHRVAAGWLIDQAGLKSSCVGGASISPVHGNFFLNNDHATARDVATLVANTRGRVHERFGVTLVPEVQFYGFAESVQ